MDPIFILIIALLASALLQFFDGSLGMGYGSMTPLLILIGVDPLKAVIAVIVSSFVLSLLTGILHHRSKNVDLSFDSKSFHLVLVLSGFGLLGAYLGSTFAIQIPDKFLKLYIGTLVLIIGSLIFFSPKTKKGSFSWAKISGLGLFAAFNKALSGGGYGPVLAGGQIISGVKSKTAVSVTALSESFASLFAIISFFILDQSAFFDGKLIAMMLLGGLASTPLAVQFVKRSEPEKLRTFVACMSITIGITTIAQVFL